MTKKKPLLVTLPRRAAWWVASLTLVVSPGVWAVLDPEKTVGPEECSECHEAEVNAWKETHHHNGYRTLSRSKEGKAIAKKMGVRRIKADSDCLTCHFTVQSVKGKEKAIAGTSCESCHNPARDWLKVHNDYGGKDTKREQETAEHKKKRLAQMDAAGMIRAGQFYPIAVNCYQCHLVPNEKLVNVGGHTPGSDFELVAWSQGEIRHNFARSADGKQNPESPVEDRRMMYVVGALVELEYSLRSVAKGTEKADYAIKMAKRTKRAISHLEEINGLLKAPELEQAIQAAKAARLKLNNEAELTQAADQVGKAAQAFTDEHEGSQLAAVDSLLPKANDYKGNVSQ